VKRWISAAAIAAFAFGSPAAGRGDGASDAEALVRAIHYEGIPRDRARALDAAGLARLGAMLEDPAEIPHHGNIVEALGLCGQPAAFAILRVWADRAPTGEVARGTFRARVVLGQAMGRLAQSDPRALAWLLAEAARPPADPAWSFRHLRGGALRTLLEEQILSGLALSGAPEARAAIDAALAVRGDDPLAERRRRHARFAHEVHDRVARGAPDTAAGESPELPGPR
jgi:hypothetical protein